MKTIRVKQTLEGLYYNADDIEDLLRGFNRVYPTKSLRILWDVVRTARREYQDGTQSSDDNDYTSFMHDGQVHYIDRYLAGK
jgi:hypothetical protein